MWGAVNSGFRAPTLTELYRQFSVGAVTTRPNDQLGPERLVGGEAGVNVAPARNVTAALTWFDNRDQESGVERHADRRRSAQKQNLGETRVWGVQTDVEYRLGTSLAVLGGGYLYDQAKVTDGGVANAGAGRQVPAAGAASTAGRCRSRTRIRSIANVALGVQFVGPAVQRRPEREFHPGRDADRRRATTRRYAGRAAGLHGRRSDRVARHRSQSAGVFRRAEPVRPGVFRPDQPVDDRHAAPGQRRARVGSLAARVDGRAVTGELPRAGWPSKIAAARTCGLSV